MTNFSAARQNMVEAQVRPNGITDHRIIAALAAIARENFVPEERRAVAYMDGDVPLTGGAQPRFLIEAMAFARLVQLAEIRPTDKVLHVGAGTGYGTAVLARLAQSVVAVESDAVLASAARGNVAGLANVTLVEAPLAAGARAEAPFDAIVIEGRIGDLPPALAGQLAEGGRLVAVVGESDVSRAQIWRLSNGTLGTRAAFDASVAPLPGFARKTAAFVF